MQNILFQIIVACCLRASFGFRESLLINNRQIPTFMWTNGLTSKSYCLDNLSKDKTHIKSSVEDTSADYTFRNDNFADVAKSALKIGYKFSRPHTIKVV